MTTSTNTPTPPESQGVINVRRVSLHAYNTAVHAARDAAGLVPRLDTDHAAWAELEDADLAQDGSLHRQWSHALGAAPEAPVQINLVARQDGVAFTTDVVLLPGLGLATTQRSITDPESEMEPDAQNHEPAVELVAFAPEEIWPVIRRVLPPHEAMRADPRPTPSAERGTLPAPQVHDPRAPQVSLLVSAHHDGKLLPIGLHKWVLLDEQLYSLAPDASSLTTLNPGAIAHELIYLVTGALSASSQADQGAQA